jgi:hypothetical protein
MFGNEYRGKVRKIEKTKEAGVHKDNWMEADQ